CSLGRISRGRQQRGWRGDSLWCWRRSKRATRTWRWPRPAVSYAVRSARLVLQRHFAAEGSWPISQTGRFQLSSPQPSISERTTSELTDVVVLATDQKAVRTRGPGRVVLGSKPQLATTEKLVSWVQLVRWTTRE